MEFAKKGNRNCKKKNFKERPQDLHLCEFARNELSKECVFIGGLRGGSKQQRGHAPQDAKVAFFV